MGEGTIVLSVMAEVSESRSEFDRPSASSSAGYLKEPAILLEIFGDGQP